MAQPMSPQLLIRQAYDHLPGIGPERLRRIHALQIRDWQDLLRRAPEIPLGIRRREQIAARVAACEHALAARDLGFLVRTLAPRDHWRILAEFFPQAAYFDIETAGLHDDSPITHIACYARGALHSYVRHENLTAFLDQLENIELLVSFNGASFDVPKVLREFHIPALPCPHIDLRWLCYHARQRGGLKSIERALGIQRPADVRGMNGDDAVWLWTLWEHHGNRTARERLIRYGCADALALEYLAATLLRRCHHLPVEPSHPDAWSLLDQTSAAAESPLPSPAAPASPPSVLEGRLERHWRRLRIQSGVRH